MKYRQVRDSESAELRACRGRQEFCAGNVLLLVGRKDSEVMAALNGLQCALGETETEMALQQMRRRAASQCKVGLGRPHQNANARQVSTSTRRTTLEYENPQWGRETLQDPSFDAILVRILSTCWWRSVLLPKGPLGRIRPHPGACTYPFFGLPVPPSASLPDG